MKKRQVSFLVGILLLLFVFCVVVIAVAAIFLVGDGLPVVGRASVGLIKVEGVISDTTEPIRQLRKYAENHSVRAIVLRINSPGGSVGGSQELYSEIVKVRKKHRKPIVASMGNVAASGGYYVACAADEIFANPGTLTGSIGAVFQTYNVKGVGEKIGVRVNTIKSGEFKDTGSMFRDMTDNERALIQGTIDDVYDQFIEAILSTRRTALANALLAGKTGGSSPTVNLESGSGAAPEGGESGADPAGVALEEVDAYLRSKADGRVLTGRQAKELGLVDSLGNLRDAITRAAKLGNISGTPFVMQERRKPTFWDMFESRASVLAKLAPKNGVSLEYRLSFD